jgi:allophanate hydrolase subunit 2
MTGPGTSIQDLGRVNGSRYGIPTSGVMDRKSFFWVNHVLQNPSDAAVLEVTQPGLTIEFDAPTLIAVAGGKAELYVNSNPIANSGLLSIVKGDVLKIGKFQSGCRIYIGIKFGFQTEKILDSRSFFEPITGKSMLHRGEFLPYITESVPVSTFFSKPRWKTDWFEKEELEAYPGPDWNLLLPIQQELMIKTAYHVSHFSNRMGIQLEELVKNELPELPTNPVFPGTVQ